MILVEKPIPAAIALAFSAMTSARKTPASVAATDKSDSNRIAVTAGGVGSIAAARAAQPGFAAPAET